MNKETSQKYRILKAKLNVTEDYFAELFGFKNANSLRASSARDRYIEALIRFYEKVKEPLI